MAMEILLPIYYRVEIDASGLGGAAPADGFVDHTKPEEYSAFPTNNTLSLQKERANMRWEEVVRQVSEKISPVYVLEIEATGADQDNPATLFSVTFGYDREEYIFTEDEDNPGTTLSAVDAVKRWVARALIVDLVENRYIYYPDVVNGNPQGAMIENVTADAIAADLATAEANITVIEVDLTT